MAHKKQTHIETLQVIADSVVMTSEPDIAAEATNELLFGECVELLNDQGEWQEVRSKGDGYRGFIPEGMLHDEITAPTHRITALRSFAYCEPDYKSPTLRALSFMSPLSVALDDQGYALLEQGSWVSLQHITPIADLDKDISNTAKMFLGTPYLWGGRTSIGLDCSALVQLVCARAGVVIPRDTKDQVKAIGKPYAGETLQANDIVFFDGHVGIMMDQTHMINATARKMHVCIEPMKDVIAAYKEITAVARI